MIARPQNLYAHYHAHVYFGPDTVAQARELCEQAGAQFNLRVGRVHEKLVGPHPHEAGKARQAAALAQAAAAAGGPVTGTTRRPRRFAAPVAGAWFTLRTAFQDASGPRFRPACANREANVVIW